MTTWDGTLPDLLAGFVPDGDDWDEVIGALHGLTDGWTAYTPAWTSTGTLPDIGNGTIAGAYIRSGKLAVVRTRLLMGSTTTFGTGAYLIGLPVNAVGTSGAFWHGAAYLRDLSAGGGGHVVGNAVIDAANPDRFFLTSSVSQVASTAPFTWASGDHLSATVVYEAA